MRILILTQYYPPETGAPQNRLSDLAQRLARSGHHLTILTALPNYPRGEIFAEYRGRVLMEEAGAGVRIVRTWIYATHSKGFIRRLLNYFSFVLSSLVLGAWKVGPADVIVVESPPLFLGISGMLLSLFKKAKLVFNVSDLWPESAITMGILKNRGLIRLSQRLEEFIYKRSVLITAQTQGIVDNIRPRVGEKRVALLTNGVDTAAFLRAATSAQRIAIRHEFGFADKFVIGYAGLHGLAQGLETVVQAARLLSEREDLLFVFFGDGPEKKNIMDLAQRLCLRNICFCPPQPALRMPAIFSAFDLALVPLKRLELFKGALPSKMFEAMAAGVPVIVTAEGEARELIGRAQAGMAIEAENAEAMAKAILELRQQEPYLKIYGSHGQRYVMEHYDREKIAQQFERLLIDTIISDPRQYKIPAISHSRDAQPVSEILSRHREP